MKKITLVFIGLLVGQIQVYASQHHVSTLNRDTPSAIITIGVQSCLGREVARQKWQPTIDYLNRQLPKQQFELVVIDTPDDAILYKMVAEKKLDYVISQPIATVELKATYGVEPALTRSNIAGWDQLGSVIFTSSNNPSIQSVESLKGNSFAASSPKRLGGWVLALDYLYDQGIQPEEDFTEIRFLGNQDNVVKAVTTGVMDAGTVRTSVIEQLIRMGRLDRDEIKVLNPKHNFPHLLSTPLVSEWSFGALKHSNKKLTQDITNKLLELTHNNSNPQWIESHDYKQVINLMKKHRLGIYQDPGHVRFYKKNYQWVLITLLLIGYLIIFVKNRQEKEIQSYKAQLEQLSRVSSVDQLLSEVAHELSQPITSLKIDAHVLSDMLQQEDCSSEQARITSNDLRDKTDHCANLILNIRNFLSHKKIHKETFAINPHIERVATLIKNELNEDKISLQLTLGSGLAQVRMSPVELDQVLLNLCKNAISAMHDNHKVQNTLHIKTLQRAQSVLIIVEDSGCQINNTEHLFELFHSTKKDSGVEGLGLGLNLSRRMIRSYGGELSLQESSHSGSTFLIRLPVANDK